MERNSNRMTRKTGGTTERRERGSSAETRSTSRSRSRSRTRRGETPTRVLSKKERRAQKRAERERAREAMELEAAGIREVSVVCEDIRQGVRKIKQEVIDESVQEPSKMGAEKKSIAEAGAGGKRRKMDDRAESEGVSYQEMATITRELREFLMNDANRVTKWVADRVLAQASKYESVMQRLLYENARLQGQLQTYECVNDKLIKDVCENVCKVRDGMTGVSQAVVQVKTTVEGMDAGVKRVSEEVKGISAGGASATAKPGANVKKSYAVIVRGAKEDMTCAEVKKRMAESVPQSAEVRVRAVKPVRGGGVVVEMASDRDRKALSSCAGFAQAGLRVEEPRKMDPRIVVYDVPCSMTEETFLKGVYDKSVNGCMPEDEFRKRVRVIKRFGKDGKPVGNIVIQMPMICCERILSEGRVYIDWSSYKACAWERVERCYACLGYGHRLRECKSERLCWRCGKPGHHAASCKAPEDCSNCRARKLPSAHSAMSPKCPEYERRLNVLRSRIANA